MMLNQKQYLPPSVEIRINLYETEPMNGNWNESKDVELVNTNHIKYFISKLFIVKGHDPTCCLGRLCRNYCGLEVF